MKSAIAIILLSLASGCTSYHDYNILTIKATLYDCWRTYGNDKKAWLDECNVMEQYLGHFENYDSIDARMKSERNRTGRGLIKNMGGPAPG